MTAATPDPGPEEEQPGCPPPRGGGQCGPRFTFAPGSQLDGVPVSVAVPAEMLPGGERAGGPGGGLDWQALMEALAGAGKIGSDPEGLGEQAARAEGRMGPMDPGVLGAMAVEHMAPGAALAGWLEVAAAAAPRLDENQLTGLAIGAGHQAAHAQAVRLSAVAQLAARAAAADPGVGVGADGRPARLTRDAAGQIEMGLRLSHDRAQALADLAVTLTWRLADTGALLAAGYLDLDQATLIAQYTSVLSEARARQVQAKILPAARGLTYAKLRQAGSAGDQRRPRGR